MKEVRGVLLVAAGMALLWSAGCGGGSSNSSSNSSTGVTATPAIASSGSNVAPIAVNAGPDGNYANGAFATVTVCVPGTSTCQTIDGVLVDTGSSGLRILSSVLTISLPQQKAPDGNAVVECLPFVTSFTWGPVETADVQIAGEKAASVPIQVPSDEDFTVPSACSNGSASADTVSALGANGILGVGLFAQDCGSACAQTGAGNPGLYYECPSSNCASTGTVANEAVAQQVVNPVTMFASDNNGVILELPAVSGVEASVSGSLVFGIGTESNNGLGTASVYSTDASGNFTVSYNGQSYSSSFIDSGSNGYFFLTSSLTGLPNCSSASGFYCPSSAMDFSATNLGTNGTSGSVTFSVANAQTLFSNTSDSAFGNLGGPSTNNASTSYFDWGLPFFYGRNVYTAIENASTPGGAGPYWAY